MLDKDKRNQFQGLVIVGVIWLLGAISDRIWFAVDHLIPAWDQADYLTGTLNYWQALQHPQWFSSEWWTSFWLISSKIPPLTYIAAAIIQNIFGIGTDQATIVNLLFSGILLGSVYGLGVQLFSVEVGLWAAGLCQILPSLYQSRLDFLLDYPLTAAVTLSFWCLTGWKNNRTAKTQRKVWAEVSSDQNFSRERAQRRGWLWAAAFGVSFGLALLVKQTALFFLLTPLVWVAVAAIRKRKWQSIFQLIGALLLSVVVFGPWYRTNWLLVLTSGKRATIDSAIAEGDPALNTLAAWTYYWKNLPTQVSWLLLLVPIVGLILYWKQANKRVSTFRLSPPPFLMGAGGIASGLSPFIWLAVFWIGAYLLNSLNINKDARYVLPYLPAVALFLAYGLTSWGGRWRYYIRWVTVGLAVILMFLNIYPIAGVSGNSITQILSPNAQHYAYLGTTLPHQQVIEEIIQTEPYLRSTLGVLPSTAEVNQHNFNYYGALKDFQVYGRQVGTKTNQIDQDARSLDWFVTKTGNQGSVPEAQAAIVQNIEESPNFQLFKTWALPDNSNLKLYHRRIPSVQVTPVTGKRQRNKITLSQVTVPQQTPPGVPVPVTYKWRGSWKQLQSSLIILTWQNQAIPSTHRWLHDHSIGMGTIQSSYVPNQSADFEVIEEMAMLPPADIEAGIYTLKATYLNRQTGENYLIPVPPVTLKIEPKVAAIPAPELDLVTQLRTLATVLPKGIDALGPVFDEIARINQYDPIQDYIVQTQQSLEYRLKLEPQNLNWAYALALSRILKQQAKEAIAALERVTQLDSQNPYAYAYLAFVHLYDWHGAAAQSALSHARALSPNLPELQILSGVAALMQGNLIQAWHYLSVLRSLAPS